jgi:integrase/recombinase XerD
MIDTLFSQRPHLARQLSAPMLVEREQYLRHLMEKNACKSHIKSAASMLLNVIEFLEFDSPRMICLTEIEEASRRWVSAKPWRWPRLASPDISRRFVMYGAGWIRFLELLEDQVAPVVPFEEILIAYVTHLVKVRGLQPSTVKSYREHTAAFLKWLGPRQPEFSAVTSEDAAQYLTGCREQGLKIGTIATLGQRLRGFFRFAEDRRLTPHQISNTIDSPIVRRYDARHKGPSWSDAQKLMRAEPNETKHAKQARVLVTLCAIYGLRGKEAEQLTLDDLDWRDEMIVIKRVKGGKTQRFPLNYKVGNAILDYLQTSRPRTRSRNLFVSLSHPHQALKLPALRSIAKNRMMRLGIQTPNYGLHSLRHSCATQLLHKGASFHEIADFLGHSDTSSVCVYAKPSAQSVRKVANLDLEGLI